MKYLAALLIILWFNACSNIDDKEYNKLLRNHNYKYLKAKSLKCIEKGEGDMLCYKYLGFAYSGLGQYEKCIEVLTKYLDNSSYEVLTLIKLGDCHFKIGEFKLAQDVFTKAKEIDPKAKNLNYNLGLLEMQSNQLSSAITYFTSELNYHGLDFNTLGARADCYEELGYYKKAIEDATKALAIDSNSYDVIHTLSSSQIMIGELDSAFLVLTKAKSLYPDSSEIYVKLAAIYGSKNKYNRAIQEAKKAINLNISNDNAVFLIALSFLNLEIYDSACHYYEIAKEMNPNYNLSERLVCN